MDTARLLTGSFYFRKELKMSNKDWKIHKRLLDLKTVYIYPSRGSDKVYLRTTLVMDLLARGYRVINAKERIP